MQHLYVLRRFSSWSFRLGVSVALLLSGTGLAASLLVGVVLGEAAMPQASWKPTLGFQQITSQLGTESQASAQVLPVSLSGMIPTYSFAASPAYSAPLLSPADSRATEQATDPTADFLPTASTMRITVQRSWDTFKLAFR